MKKALLFVATLLMSVVTMYAETWAWNWSEDGWEKKNHFNQVPGNSNLWEYNFANKGSVSSSFCVAWNANDNYSGGDWKYLGHVLGASADIVANTRTEIAVGQGVDFAKDSWPQNVTKAVIRKDGDKYYLTLFTEGKSFNDEIIPKPTKHSPYKMEVWSLSEQSGPWDISGGLYAYNEGSYLRGYKTENGVRVEDRVQGAFPIDSKYIGYVAGSNNKYLNFYGPLDQDEIAEINAKFDPKLPHAVKWTQKTRAGYQDEGENGHDAAYYRELMGGVIEDSDSELYMIDFTSGGEEKGIYVKVPTVEEMDLNDKKTKPEYQGVQHFYRMGIRFGFFDETFDENPQEASKTTLYRMNRFIKWGHTFRLNEVSRPMNAFPQIKDGTLYGYTDDFGPNAYNGHALTEANADQSKYSQENDTDFSKLDWNSLIGPYNNKRGDCRILAERNFWLKRIFLEAVECGEVDGKKLKRFYVYFSGEYDLDGESMPSFANDFFVPAEDGTNYVNGSPNIWHGINFAAEEPAFHKFYNLDPENGKDLIGLDPSEYAIYNNKKHYLYHMDLTRKYTVNSEYKVYAKDVVPDGKNMVTYLDDKAVQNELSYIGVGGHFYALDKDGYIKGTNIHSNKAFKDTPMPATAVRLGTSVDSNKLLNLNGLSADVLTNPDRIGMKDSDRDLNPGQVTIESTYSFPNMAFPTVVKHHYKFDGKHSLEYDKEFEVNKTDVFNTKDEKGNYAFAAQWNKYPSIEKTSALYLDNKSENKPAVADLDNTETTGTGKDKMPVSKYVIKYYIDDKSGVDKDQTKYTKTVADPLFENGYFGAKSFIHVFNIKDEPAVVNGNVEGKYIHYMVEAWYNMAYPTNGLLKTLRLYDHGEPSELLIKDDKDKKDDNYYTQHNVSHTFGEGSEHSALESPVEYVIDPFATRGFITYPMADAVPTSVEGIETEATAPHYYDLQGFEVKNPVAGQLYIVRRGANVTKQIYR